MKSKIAVPLALASALFGYTAYTPTYYTLFGGKKSEEKESSIEQTKTYIWGNGIYQPRPDATMKFRNFEPKLIKTFLGSKNINLKDVSFGPYHEGGITTQGAVYIWRKHVMDASVSENDDVRSEVTLLDGSKNNKQLTFSRGFAWILKENGEVFQHQIKVNVDNESDTVKSITIGKSARKIEELKDIVQIGTGEDHFIALDKNGEVWSMGDDTLGQCGIGAQKRNNSPPYFEKRVRKPEKVNNISNIKKIVCGANHTLALNGDGIVYGWGSNSNMQLSHHNEFAQVDNPLLAIFQPLRIEKELNKVTVTDIAAGEQFSMFVARNRANQETEVYGCGHNLNGQLGAGIVSHVQDVTKVESLSNYRIQTKEGEQNVRINQISCGKGHCMALLNIGAMLVWGGNEAGQLGNRKRVFSENPIIMKEFADDNVIKVCAGQYNSAVVCEHSEKIEEIKRLNKEKEAAKKKKD